MEQALSQLYARVLERYRSGTELLDFHSDEDTLGTEFSSFLNSLVRPEERLQQPASVLDTSVEELSAAGYAYIRELLFKTGNNHYQVLGLSQDTDRDQIRRRYRLLISLFHPDRISSAQQWEQQAVRRLNLSYGVLKRPEKRKIYDADLRREQHRPKAERPVSKPADASVRTRKKAPLSAAPKPTDAIYRVAVLQRHPKLFVWMGIGLSVAFVFLLTISGTSNNALMLSEPSQRSTKVADLVPDSPLLPEKDWRSPNLETMVEDQAPSLKISSGKPLAEIEIVVPKPSIEPEKEKNIEATPQVAVLPSSDSSNGVQKNAPVKKPKPVSSPKKTPAHLPPKADPEIAKVSNVSDKTPLISRQPKDPIDLAVDPAPIRGFDGASLPGEPLAHVPAVTEKGKTPNQAIPYMQPEYVLMQYVRAYEAGDLNKLLHLFTLDVQTNTGHGRQNLRDSYGKLFEATKQRHFTLKQLKINSVDADHYVAWAQVAAHTVSMLDDSSHQYGGEMMFELLPKGRRLYIHKIKHNIQVTER